jgi:hypothetical protein
MLKSEIEIVNAYGHLIKSRLDMGWLGYLISFMFRELPGSLQTRLHQMHEAISNVFPKVITRVVRKPTSSKWSHHLPIGVFFPDLPVYKKSRQAIPDILINDGLHIQGIIVATPEGRLKDVTIPLDLYFHECWWKYLRDKLYHLDLRPITHDEILVADYLGKIIKRRRFSTDDIMVLPKTIDELVGRHIYVS